METIEERAKAVSEGCDDDEYLAGLYMGYVVGATEQKAIDDTLIKKLFEKAWSLADSMYQVGKDHLTPLTHQEFIKEMEDIARALNK